MSDLTPKQIAAVDRLRAALKKLDEQTRLPGEEPLLKTVARQAREARTSHDSGNGS
jgi:hypothetical protein